MDPVTGSIIGAFFVGGGVSAFVNWFLNRKKSEADAADVIVKSALNIMGEYKKEVGELRARIDLLEDEVELLRKGNEILRRGRPL
jgi:cell division protein FtsB